MRILVCPLSQLKAAIAHKRPSFVVSVLDPGADFPVLGEGYADRHLRLAFHDAHLDGAGITLASAEHMATLLHFVRRWNGTGPLLVHCRAGIGRSTAMAFVAACAQHPAVPELEMARALRRAAPLARPNETVVHLADLALGRGGRMSAAIAETGRGLPWINVAEGVPFELLVPASATQ